MKTLIYSTLIIALGILFISCETDYAGTDPENIRPYVRIAVNSDDNLTDITVSGRTRVEWFGNDIDGSRLRYYYTVTTDTSLTSDNVLASLPLSAHNQYGVRYWTVTDRNYAMIAMPFGPYNSDLVYMTDTVYSYVDSVFIAADSTWVVTHLESDFRAVWSKFFVFGVDERGGQSRIDSKIFRRTNRPPKFPMVYSQKLGLNGYDKYWMTVGPDSAQIVLEEENQNWKAFDFRWMGEDPDGLDAVLEFKWELRDRTEMPEGESEDMPLIMESNWSTDNVSVRFSKVLYDQFINGRHRFRFIVRVRDDAYEESEFPSTINFEVFAPAFNKGILFIDDTDPVFFPPTSNLIMGNPDADAARSFYISLLEYAGLDTAGTGTVPSKEYTIRRYTALEGEDQIFLGLRELCNYELVIIVSDDRSNKRGVDFNTHNKFFAEYLQTGGSMFIIGPSVLYGRDYSSPDQLPINRYSFPYRYIFDGLTVMGQSLNPSSERFLREYFGIYSMTFPESKTYFTENSPNQPCNDHFLTDNYDFIGVDIAPHISDHMIRPLRIDSVKVNKAWFDLVQGERIRRLSLKDNGTVFTGIPTIEVEKGEVVYIYRSIYDLPREGDYALNINGTDTLRHYLKNTNYVTGEVHSSVLRRHGAVATRYISDQYHYRTAFFGMPLYFMDNSSGYVKDMFKSMIEWFSQGKNRRTE